MKFNGLRVYDMEESIVASGFPMISERMDFEEEVGNLKFQAVVAGGLDKLIEEAKVHTKDSKYVSDNYRKAILHTRRAMNLGNAIAGSGHDCMQKGIVVNVNITAPQHFWLQFERYHHQDTISSMSTMHRITRMDINTMTNDYVDPRIIEVLKELIAVYNENPTSENFHKVVNNIPEGVELTRRISTNYLQLKTMYSQRKNHKMEDWSRDFVEFCHQLPCFEDFCLQKSK